ncbi:uncharacterized protein BJ171DRAFT_569804 [Polychytrium aggregatum]|uniref:uncharacterized protein n=1 Tax=Polychytrium aggregatum TaxID=110093 RepID=UPI0022FE7F0C|nr:uncharacterized protein BJ171DRAFT_569804 [Polychytrium aggregatum]KAI9202158.1 hypothetical protein BJ171DRAFT_569804 [Polychytrium aggregatum]
MKLQVSHLCLALASLAGSALADAGPGQTCGGLLMTLCNSDLTCIVDSYMISDNTGVCVATSNVVDANQACGGNFVCNNSLMCVVADPANATATVCKPYTEIALDGSQCGPTINKYCNPKTAQCIGGTCKTGSSSSSSSTAATVTTGPSQTASTLATATPAAASPTSKSPAFRVVPAAVQMIALGGMAWMLGTLV